MKRELLQAIENDDARKVRELLTSEVDLNFEDDDGDFPLYVASWRGNKEIVELLLTNGADVNYEADAYFYTALMIASGNGHAEICSLSFGKRREGQRRGRLATDFFDESSRIWTL